MRLRDYASWPLSWGVRGVGLALLMVALAVAAISPAQGQSLRMNPAGAPAVTIQQGPSQVESQATSWGDQFVGVRGWPVRTHAYPNVTPADLDGNGVEELVVVNYRPHGPHGMSGPFTNMIAIFDRKGTLLGIPAQIFDGDGTGIGMPAIADLDGNGKLEIIVAPKVAHPTSGDDPKIYVLTATGAYLPGWPKRVAVQWASTPVVTDLDPVIPGLEIIFACSVPNGTSNDGDVYLAAWSKDGVPLTGFPVYLGSGWWQEMSDVSVADIDGDGTIEIIVTAIKQLHVLDKAGNEKAGYPVAANGGGASALCTGDLDGNGMSEIVHHARNMLTVYDHKGAVLWTNSQLPAVEGQIVLGDLDWDGKAEIIVGGYGDSRVHALHHDGSLVQGWPFDTGAPFPCRVKVSCVGDLDGDLCQEVVVSTVQDVWVLGHDGRPLKDADPLAKAGFFWAGHSFVNSICDTDSDGNLELTSALPIPSSYYYFDGIAEVHIWEYNSTKKTYRGDWRMWGADLHRTSHYKRK